MNLSLVLLFISCQFFAISAVSNCKCGIAPKSQSQKSRWNRIIRGKPTEEHEFPWMAHLYYVQSTPMYNVKNREPMCGGSLISNRWILTASHCTYLTTKFELLFPWDIEVVLRDPLMPGQRQWRGVQEIRRHPHFVYGGNYNNDLALLKLVDNVNFAEYEHIRPICLPYLPRTYEGQIATVAGWGATPLSARPDIRLKTNVRVLSNDQCRSHHSINITDITDQMICTTPSVCSGDSGGPLMTVSSEDGVTPGENFELIGVVSWSKQQKDLAPCSAWDTSPHVFARVTEQLAWINAIAIDGFQTCPRR